jgi:hypothetical protein
MAESAQASAIDARVHRGLAIDPVMRLGQPDQLRVDPGTRQALIPRRCCQRASGRSNRSLDGSLPVEDEGRAGLDEDASEALPSMSRTG